MLAGCSRMLLSALAIVVLWAFMVSTSFLSSSTCVYACVYICICVCACACMCECAYTCTCTSTTGCIHMYTSNHSHTEALSDLRFAHFTTAHFSTAHPPTSFLAASSFSGLRMPSSISRRMPANFFSSSCVCVIPMQVCVCVCVYLYTST